MGALIKASDPETNPMPQARLQADDASKLIGAMQRTLELELAGLSSLKDALGASELEAIRIIAGLKGRLICAGVGKSGHVARKIAATFASTGTPSQYVHPSEASHGDLGMITADDAVLALSKSGETRELGDIVAYCRRFGVPLMAMTAGLNSTLAKGADLVLLLPEAEEACGETRAPTTSTTMMMAYGDALAVALIEARGFTARDFARFHPGGALGSALARVDSLMHGGDGVPLVEADAVMGQALIVMSEKGFGCVGVIDAERRLAGIITDGDLRRKMGPGFTEAKAADVMTADPITVAPDLLASDALRQMTAGNRKITQLFVCDASKRPVGLLHIHDLLRAGVS
jgi:arabinose-5-phosphate isomerase